jgi:serine/threonine protein kinase
MAAAGGRKKRVGRYEVGRTIGQGSFAKVKFAVDSDTGTAVAMKVIEKDTILSHRMLHQVPGGAPSSSPNFSVSLETNPNRVPTPHFSLIQVASFFPFSFLCLFLFERFQFLPWILDLSVIAARSGDLHLENLNRFISSKRCHF